MTSPAGRSPTQWTSSGDETATAGTTPTREPFIDNVKAALIGLVVVGHTIGQFVVAVPGADTVYTWVYLFHMPAFVLLCGVLSTSPDIDGRRVASMTRTLLLPYVAFQVLYVAYFREVGGQEVPWTVDTLLTPIYHLWFLVSLFLWRLLVPFLLRQRAAVTVAVAVSLGAGTSDVLGPALSLDRTASLLPFFVIGLLLGREALRIPTGNAVRTLAVAVLVASLPAAALFHDRLGRGWLFWRATYRELGHDVVEGSLVRLLMLGWALLLTAAVIALVPRGRSLLTRCGERSMYPYLLHAFVVQAFGWSSLDPTTVGEAVLAVILAVVVTVALAVPAVGRAFRPLVEPRRAWVLR